MNQPYPQTRLAGKLMMVVEVLSHDVSPGARTSQDPEPAQRVRTVVDTLSLVLRVWQDLRKQHDG